jgi:hypothetical protein
MARVFVVIATVSALVVVAAGGELAEPVRIMAAGEYIDTDTGNAAPMVYDFDRDGAKDLLVGQFGDGLLWIYRNEGSNAEPKLRAGRKFMDGKPDGCVPSG